MLVVRAADDGRAATCSSRVAGAVGQGRLLAVGDASIVMNAMLRYPGNATLARDLVRYATEDDAWGKRGGKLYILANDFETTGAFGDDSRCGGAAGERAARARARRSRRSGTTGCRRSLAYLVALAVGLGVVVWTSSRAGRTHKAVVPRFVRPMPARAQGGVAGHAAVIGGARHVARPRDARAEERARGGALRRASASTRARRTTSSLAKLARGAGCSTRGRRARPARLLATPGAGRDAGSRSDARRVRRDATARAATARRSSRWPTRRARRASLGRAAGAGARDTVEAAP